MNIVEDIVKKEKNFIEKLEDSHKELDQECEAYLKEIDNFLKTGKIEFFKKLNIGKENAEPAIVSIVKRKCRAKKPALADITENNISNNTFSIKKEKISDIQHVSTGSDTNLNDAVVEVKKEVEEMPAPTKLPPRKKKIKKEPIELPKRSTRTRTKANKQDEDEDIIIQNTTVITIELSEESERDTETESEIEKDKTENEVETRTTRSKMRNNKPGPIQDQMNSCSETDLSNEKLERIESKKIKSIHTKTRQKKRNLSDSNEELHERDRKKSKSVSNTEQEQECNGSIQTEYEDAVSTIENIQDNNKNANATYVASSRDTQMPNERVSNGTIVNSTVVVENPKMITKDQVEKEKNLPENEFKQMEPSSPKNVKKTKATKQIFSPFEKTPLKKKVEAFEKLGAEASSIPTRVTRTKKKAQKQNDIDDNEMRSNEEEERLKTAEKEKNRIFTPITTKFLPKVCSTSKINKLHPSYSDISTSNESVLSVKSASALKASQAEFREREKRRQEKEREALKKREALLQAQTEEKRRKREEKQQKAQQQREILEKEKQKQLEAQKIKEEKYKQAIAEREEKLQKQKEEAEKKRLMVKKKANELLKEKEEIIRIAEQKKYAEMKAVMDKQSEMAKLAMKQKMERAQQQHSTPLYMTTKPPLLPTDDCYDSDDPDFEKVRRHEPAWSKDKELREMQIAMITAGETIKNTFFCRHVQTPDLQEIFEIIDPRKLKRTSSAIWRKPPRYTLMPTIEDQHEFSEESD